MGDEEEDNNCPCDPCDPCGGLPCGGGLPCEGMGFGGICCCCFEGGPAEGISFCADTMECCADCLNCIADVCGIFASPLGFLFVFCFDGGDEPRYWDVPMLQAPCKKPCICCVSCCCAPIAQYYVRKHIVLGGDISKYKLFQGYFDGPYCMARSCPSMPFTLQAGTHGDQGSECHLCCEVCCCPFCAFDVSRMTMRDERGLGRDPTEIKVDNCLEFFGMLADLCCCAGCCLWCTGCCVRCFLPEDGEDFADASQKLGGAMMRIAHLIRRGMWHVRNLAVACMSSQMQHEATLPLPSKEELCNHSQNYDFLQQHYTGSASRDFRGGSQAAPMAGSRPQYGGPPACVGSQAAWMPPPQPQAMASAYTGPVPEHVAARFIQVLQEEYLKGDNGAVGDFFEDYPELESSLARFEDQVRDAVNRPATIDAIARQWNLRVPGSAPLQQSMAPMPVPVGRRAS